jgi:hypothetical protein
MKITTALMGVLICFGMSSAFAEQQDVERVLLGGNKGDGPWWGGGVDFTAPGCANIETCSAAQALQFNNNTGKIGVKIFDTKSHQAFRAYSQGKRFPGDTQQRYGGQQWVQFGPNETFSWVNNYVSWDCKLVSNVQFDCKWRNNTSGGNSLVHFFRLPRGPSPTTWPD